MHLACLGLGLPLTPTPGACAVGWCWKRTLPAQPCWLTTAPRRQGFKGGGGAVPGYIHDLHSPPCGVDTGFPAGRPRPGK